MLSPLQVYTCEIFCAQRKLSIFLISLTRPVPNHDVTYDATPLQFHFSHSIHVVFMNIIEVRLVIITTRAVERCYDGRCHSQPLSQVGKSDTMYMYLDFSEHVQYMYK